jgi:DNA-binding PadR family transcriptional regulator
MPDKNATACTQEPREIRKWLLITLEKSYPYGASEELLGLTLAGLRLETSPGELRAHLAYLEEKGYLGRERVEVRRAGVHRHVAKLTAAGKDLLEGNIEPDPGVAG